MLLTNMTCDLVCYCNFIVYWSLCYLLTGDWLLAVIQIGKQFGFLPHKKETSSSNLTFDTYERELSNREQSFLRYFNNVHWYILLSVSISFLSYYLFVGWLKWSFYIKRKEQVSYPRIILLLK